MADPKLDELAFRASTAAPVDPVARLRERMLAGGIVKVAGGGGDGGPGPGPAAVPGIPFAGGQAPRAQGFQAGQVPVRALPPPGFSSSTIEQPSMLPPRTIPGQGLLQPRSLAQMPGLLPKSPHPAESTQWALDYLARQGIGANADAWPLPYAALRRSGQPGPVEIGNTKDDLDVWHTWFKGYLKDNAKTDAVKALKEGIPNGSVKLYWEKDTGGLSLETGSELVKNCRFETWEMRNKGKKASGEPEIHSFDKFNIHKANAALGDIVSCESSKWSWDSAIDPATGATTDSEWKKRAKEIFFGNEMVLTGQMAQGGNGSWSCKELLKGLMLMQAYALDPGAH